MNIKRKRMLLKKRSKYKSKHHNGRTVEEIFEHCAIAREAQRKLRIKLYESFIGNTYGGYKLIKILEKTDSKKRFLGVFQCTGCNKKYNRRITQITTMKPVGCKSCASFIREETRREE